MSFSRRIRDFLESELDSITDVGLLIRAEDNGNDWAEPDSPLYRRQPLTWVRDGNTWTNQGQVEFPWTPVSLGDLAAYGLFKGDGELVSQVEPDGKLVLAANYSHIITDGALGVRLPE